ncbi:MAG: hypothetical protein ABL958_12575 [Bdellovibrionia bacterium]
MNSTEPYRDQISSALYFLSAALMLGGVLLVSNELRNLNFDWIQLALPGVLNLYEMLLLAAGHFIYRKSGALNPHLAGLSALFLVDPTLQSELLSTLPVSPVVPALWYLLFLVKLRVFEKLFDFDIGAGYWVLYQIMLAGIVFFPYLKLDRVLLPADYLQLAVYFAFGLSAAFGILGESVGAITFRGRAIKMPPLLGPVFTIVLLFHLAVLLDDFSVRLTSAAFVSLPFLVSFHMKSKGELMFTSAVGVLLGLMFWWTGLALFLIAFTWVYHFARGPLRPTGLLLVVALHFTYGRIDLLKVLVQIKQWFDFSRLSFGLLMIATAFLLLLLGVGFGGSHLAKNSRKVP